MIHDDQQQRRQQRQQEALAMPVTAAGHAAPLAPRATPTARGGRPSKLTPERHDRIVDALRKGKSHREAARLASVSRRTIFRWKTRGETESVGVYRSFAAAVKQAFASDHAPTDAPTPLRAELFALLEQTLGVGSWNDLHALESTLSHMIGQTQIPGSTGQKREYESREERLQHL